MKIKIEILTIILVFICLPFLSCSNSENNENEFNLSEKEHVSEIPDSVYKSKSTENEKNECVKVLKNSIIFFKVSDKEYKDIIKSAGSYTRYDYELLFRNFNHIAKSVKQITKEKKINVRITDAERLQFITNDNDTVYFERIKEDMLLGQIFFTGKETICSGSAFFNLL